MIRYPTASPFQRRSMRPLVFCALAALALAGCSDVRRSIGLERTTPDEFAVVARSPLTMPPSFRNLPEPQPGAPRPQEPSPSEIAKASVFGKGKSGMLAANTAKSGDRSLVSRVGPVDPDIRKKVDEETKSIIAADKRWIDSVLFWQKQDEPYTIVDAKKEQDRLRQAQAEGKPVNEGVVPTIERKRKAPLEGLF